MVGVAAIALVAHVSVLQGHATIARAEGGTVVALRNAPVLAGDTVAALDGTTAEVALDPPVALRLAEESSITLLSVAPHARDVRLDYGTLDVSVARNGDAPRVETPAATLEPEAPGLYRMSVEHGTVTAIADRGTLRILTPNGTQLLSPGEQVTIEGTPAQPVLHDAALPPKDSFDGFNQTRDATPSGTANLARYGSWITLPKIGSAWQPHEPSSWAPYRDGRWFWRNGIGWTWIARESWGWTPYHYGAWLHDATRGWCWVPPHGRNAGWSSGNAAFFAIVVRGHTRSIGWVSLAPGESFHAHLNAYRNASAPGGLALIGVGDFYSGNFQRPSLPSLAQLPATIRMQAPPPPKPSR